MYACSINKKASTVNKHVNGTCASLSMYSGAEFGISLSWVNHFLRKIWQHPPKYCLSVCICWWNLKVYVSIYMPRVCITNILQKLYIYCGVHFTSVKVKNMHVNMPRWLVYVGPCVHVFRIFQCLVFHTCMSMKGNWGLIRNFYMRQLFKTIWVGAYNSLCLTNISMFK